MSLLRLVVVLCGMVAHTCVAHAEAATRSAVKLTLVGSGSAWGEFSRVLAESNLGFAVRLATHVSAADVFDTTALGEFRVWVVLVPGWGAKIYFADPAGNRFLVREVPLGAGLDESGREILAQVLATSVRAFAERQVSSTAVEVESSLRSDKDSVLRDVVRTDPKGHWTLRGSVALKSQPSLSTSRPFWHPRLGAFYAAQFMSAGAVAHGPGVLAGGATAMGAFRFMTSVHGQYQFPVAILAAGAELTLHAWAVGMTTAVERNVGAHWELGTELGLRLAHIEFGLSRVSSTTIQAASGGVHYRPGAYAGLRAGYDLGVLKFRLLLGAEVALVRTHYDIAAQPIFTPWILSPRSAIEVGWE